MKYVGELPRGCELCREGAKLVLFVTGLCYKDCGYCPLSEKRKNKDTPWANERPIIAPEDILEEAHRMMAKGAGITGGEPLLWFDRALGYVKLLKSEFGKYPDPNWYKSIAT